MNKLLLLFLLLFTFTSCGDGTPEVISNAPAMSISSTAFPNNGIIPTYYTCYGSSVRIPLQISDIPSRTKSLALFMNDPDSLSGSWHHWIMWNIDPQNTVISSSEALAYPEGANSNNTLGYIPPCPPAGSGKHRYIITAYALDTLLSLKTGAHYDDVLPLLRNHILDRVTLQGTYEK